MIQKPFIKYISIFCISVGFILFVINMSNIYIGYQAIEKLPSHQIEVRENDHLLPSFVKIQPLYKNKIKLGEKIGQLTIPKLKEIYPIYEGTTDEVLKKGVGHYSYSALPGEQNNSILSGHRDIIFRGLKDLKKSDKFIVKTKAGTFLYKIKKIRIVDAKDKSVITPSPRATLTVTTCYPFYYIGDAPKRYILVAVLISSSHKKGQSSQSR